MVSSFGSPRVGEDGAREWDEREEMEGAEMVCEERGEVEVKMKAIATESKPITSNWPGPVEVLG
jgi:hypothetical protein